VLVGEIVYENFEVVDLLGDGKKFASVYGNYKLPEGYRPTSEYGNKGRVVTSDGGSILGGVIGAIAANSAKDGLFEVTEGERLAVGETVGMNGGAFRVVVQKRQPFYFYGVHASSQGAFSTKQAVFPFPALVAPSKEPCLYVGSILLKKVGNEIEARVEDRFSKHEAGFKKFVRGCAITKQLAQTVARIPASR